MKDIANLLKAVQTVAPAVVGANDVNGDAVDLRGYNGALLVVSVGIEGDTLSGSTKFDFLLEESDNGTDFTAVAAADAIVPVQSANVSAPASGVFMTVDANGEAPAIAVVGYIGRKRYVRVTVDKTGTHTNGTPISVIALLGEAALRPVA